MELAGLVRYFMQIKGNFDLTVVITGVGIPATLREIDWPKASFAKASFSQFWSTIPSQACQLLEIRTWVHETWGKWTKRSMNVTFVFTKRYRKWFRKSRTVFWVSQIHAIKFLPFLPFTVENLKLKLQCDATWCVVFLAKTLFSGVLNYSFVPFDTFFSTW